MNPLKSPRTRFRGSILAVAAVAVCLVLTGCGSDKADTATAPATAAAPETAAPPETAAVRDTAAAETEASTAVAAPAETGSVFVGLLPGIDHGFVGVHLGEPDADGARTARVYVCDGKPTDAGGFALWFKGEVVDGGETKLTAAGRTETLSFAIGETVSGSVTFENGKTHTFDAPPAANGSGIYDVTVGENGSYVGRSTAGDALDAVIAADRKTVLGTVKLRDGSVAKIDNMTVNSEIFPGRFIAVAWWNDRTKHLAMSGRSGDVRGGSPGLNIINLCMDH